MARTLSQKRWKPEEEDIVRLHYPSKGIKYVSVVLNRSPQSVIWHASRLGVKSLCRYKSGKANGHFEAWVPDEDMEDYLKFTDEQKMDYLRENGEFLLDDWCINDRGKIESFDEEIDD